MTDPPDCPDCGTDVFVWSSRGCVDWRCRLCGWMFNDEQRTLQSGDGQS